MSRDDDAPHLALASHLQLTPRSGGSHLKINGRRHQGDVAARDTQVWPIESSAGPTGDANGLRKQHCAAPVGP